MTGQTPAEKGEGRATLEMVEWSGPPALYLNDIRITGRETKPLGGGKTVRSWQVETSAIREALFLPEPDGKRPDAGAGLPEEASRLLADIFWFLGGVDGASALRSRIIQCERRAAVRPKDAGPSAGEKVEAVATRPVAWARGVHSPGTPHGPAEYDLDVQPGDDPPDGEGWFPLYRRPPHQKPEGGVGKLVERLRAAAKNMEGVFEPSLFNPWIEAADLLASQAARIAELADASIHAADETLRLYETYEKAKARVAELEANARNHIITLRDFLQAQWNMGPTQEGSEAEVAAVNAADDFLRDIARSALSPQNQEKTR